MQLNSSGQNGPIAPTKNSVSTIGLNLEHR